MTKRECVRDEALKLHLFGANVRVLGFFHENGQKRDFFVFFHPISLSGDFC